MIRKFMSVGLILSTLSLVGCECGGREVNVDVIGKIFDENHNVISHQEFELCVETRWSTGSTLTDCELVYTDDHGGFNLEFYRNYDQEVRSSCSANNGIGPEVQQYMVYLVDQNGCRYPGNEIFSDIRQRYYGASPFAGEAVYDFVVNTANTSECND